MNKRDSQSVQSAFTYDENGTKEVSEQIMNAYNSGVIDQHYAAANVDETSTLDSGLR
jgi:hypothetical protein